jgi:hypothetical protein
VKREADLSPRERGLLAQVFGLPPPAFAAAKLESAELTRFVPDQFFADVASLHPGLVLKPLVLGPKTMPVMTDLARARSALELAVLSAMVHGKGKRGAEVALAAYEAPATAFLGRDDERLCVYQDLVDSSLSEAARQALEQHRRWPS